MEISNSTASIPKLPDDLIIEILSRLPTRSLVKFRCVSKSWLSIISTPQFIKTHLKNSKKDPNYTSQKIILNSRGNLKQCSAHSLLYEPITEAFDFDYWFNISGSLIWVVGSCDGLICLSVDRKDLILWNPSIRIWKKLPDFAVRMSGPGGPGPGNGVGRAGRIATSSRGYFAYGFGFDKSSDDYKIVGFSNGSRDLSEVSVQVYSLKSDQWKMIKNFTGRWLMDDPATFANGKLYWIANRDMGLESAWDIVSLDLETEEYEVLQMPNYVKSGYYSRLNASGGCLYVLCSHLESADLWIMDDCSVGKGSWTKVVTIPYVDDFLKYTYKKALYVLKDGQVVLLCGSTFVIFDAKDWSFRYPEVRNSGEFVAVTTYFESLVSP